MKQYNNYADLITFTRASSGTALRPISYGDELVTNGTFDTDTSGWYGVSAGVVSHDSANNALKVTALAGDNFAAGETAISTVAGKVYKIEVENLSYSGTGFQVGAATSSNGVDLLLINNPSDSSIKDFFVAESSTTYIKFGTNNNTGVEHNAVFDNVSVREVLFDQPDGTLTLFNHPTNIPRIEYDADGNRLGLLVEEARSNFITYSEDFTQWASSAASLTVDATQSPDGNENATLLASTGFSTFPRINESLSISGPTTLTFSIYVKENTGDNIFIRFTGTNFAGVGGTVSVTRFEFATEGFATASGTGATSTYQKLSNGWYRIAITLSGDTFTNIGVYPEFAETSTDSTYIYGAQLEAGSFPTSYIPSNSGSTTTRSADVASIGVSEFGYNQSEGTVFVEVADYTSKPTGSNYVVSLDDNTAANRNQIIRYNNAWIYDVKTNNASPVSVNLGTTNDPAKVAFAFNLDDFAATEDGDTVVTDTSGTVPNVTKITIGSTYNNSAQLNGHIKSIKYYPRRLTNAQLQELTS